MKSGKGLFLILEQFSAIASHDLKEPLVTVGGFLALLKRRYEGDLDGEANRHIRYALESVERMERLIGDLLDFSRVSTQARPFQDSGSLPNIQMRSSRPSGGCMTGTSFPALVSAWRLAPRSWNDTAAESGWNQNLGRDLPSTSQSR